MKYILSTLVCLVSLSLHAASEGGPRVGDKPPLLKATSLMQAPAGARFDARSLRGKVVILEFWATWCGPCVAAFPHLNELAEKFKDKPVRLVAITEEDEATVKAFLAKRPLRAWIALDADKAMNTAYGVVGIPHTVVLGKDGKIAAITYPTMLTEKHINDLLGGKKISLPAPRAGESISAGKDPDDKSQMQPLFQVLIRPSAATNGGAAWGGGNLTARAYTVRGILTMAFGRTQSRIVTNTPLPEDRYDFVIRRPGGSNDDLKHLLQEALQSAFGITGRTEMRDMDVRVLKLADANAAGLKESPTRGMSSRSGPGIFEGAGITLDQLVSVLESDLQRPVLDETGLTNRYDIALKWEQPSEGRPGGDVLVKAVRDQLGLELAPARRPVEMLVIEGPKPEIQKAER